MYERESYRGSEGETTQHAISHARSSPFRIIHNHHHHTSSSSHIITSSSSSHIIIITHHHKSSSHHHHIIIISIIRCIHGWGSGQCSPGHRQPDVRCVRPEGLLRGSQCELPQCLHSSPYETFHGIGREDRSDAGTLRWRWYTHTLDYSR